MSFFFFQAEDGIRDRDVTGVQTCALPISVNYTNAATIIGDDFKDTEDLEGVFSGMVKFTEPAFWPYNGLEGRYDNATWAYKRGPKPPPGAIGAVTAGEMHRVAPGTATKDLTAKRAGPPFDDLVRSHK